MESSDSSIVPLESSNSSIVPSNYFESPFSVRYLDDQNRSCDLVDKFTSCIYSARTPLTYHGRSLYDDICKSMLGRIDFFGLYYLATEQPKYSKRIRIGLKCEHRKRILIDVFVKSITKLVENCSISDSYVKSFLACFGKRETMFDLYKTKNYEKFVTNCYLETPILSISMVSEYNVASGDLLYYFTMERDTSQLNNVCRFLSYMKSNDVEALNSSSCLRLKEQIMQMKPLQFLGLVRQNPQWSSYFSALMSNPDKKKVLMEINIDPLVHQLEEGSITDVYVLSFLNIYRVQAAYPFFERSNWPAFMHAIAILMPGQTLYDQIE